MKRLLPTTLAAVLTLGLVLEMPGTAQAATPSSSSIAVLMQSYDRNSGRIGGGWWTGAVALSTVMTYRQATGDTQYDYAISEAFAKNSDFSNEYIDDTGWWALAWIQAYDLTGNQNYLHTAQMLANYMHDYWDGQCGGGVYWSTDKKYKAAIANELFLAVTAALHNRIGGDTTYLHWANDTWTWLGNSSLITSGNLVQDGLNVSGCAVSKATYSYNQGVVLQGLVDLSRATGNTSLLDTAKSIATAATQKFSRNGVLYDGCEPNCTGDGQSFKGIFIRYLRALATATNTTQYNGFMTTTANSILANDTNSSGQQGNSFVGPFALWSYNTQASAAAALVAAASAGIGPITGAGSKCVDVPFSNPADGTLIQLWSCNGTSAQQWNMNGGTFVALGKCLDVASGGTANGTSVQLWTCNTTGAQTWQPQSNGTLRNPQSNRCLEATGSTADGTRLVIRDCTGAANQVWRLPTK